MTDKYIFYEFDGERYKVPVSEQKEFEKQAPTAKIMLTYDKENYKVPLGELGGFLQETGVDKVTYSAFDHQKQYSPNMSTERYISFDEPAVPKVASETQPSYAEPDKFDWSATSAEMPMSKREQRRARRNMESYLRRAENEEYANAVIDSHNENKKAAEEYIERIDKEFSAYESEEPEKTFWQKLSESMRQAKAEQRLGASAFNAEQKKSDIKKGQNYVDAKIAKNIESKVEDKIKEYNDPAKTFVGGVAHGLRDTVFDIDTWDSTVGAEEAARVYSITKKLDNGEKLTEGEQLIVDALVDDLSSDIYLASEFGRGYKAGKVTGESLPFMLETAINPASGFGKSFTKKFGKEIFKRVSQKLGSKVARAAVHGTRVATDIAGAAMMSATTSQARVAEDALNRLSGQVDFSMADDGTLQFNGFTGGEDSAFKAYAKAFGANTIEHFSEMVGNYFAPIGEATKSGAIALANKVGLKRVGQLLDDMTPNGFGALINDFAEQTQWQGVFGEFAEEMVSGALNALVVGDQSLKKYDKHGNLNENYLFDKENMIDTFLGVAILGGTISAAKTLGYTTPETRYNREISRAKKNLRGILSEEEMAQLEAFAANPFGMGAANLTPFFDDNRDDDFKRAVGSYLKAVMEKKGYEISRGANLSGTQQGMNEMRNAFHLGQNMSEADLYDINEAEASAIQALRDTGIFDTMEGAAVPFLTEDALELGSYDLFAMSNDNRYTDEEKEAFRNLAIVRNAKEGLEGMLNARTQAMVDASNRIATDASQDGKLTIGVHNGQIVFIKGGVQVNNGSIVNPNASGGYPVEVVNSMTGEVSLVESSQIENVVTDDVEAYNTRMGGIISEYYQQRQDKWRNTKSAKSKLAEVEGMVGQSVYIDNGNGNNMTEVEIMQILPNGEVVLKGKKGDLGGQSTIRVDVDSFYDSMTRDANGNPIFNQSKFRSQTQNINERRNILYHGGDTTNDVAPVPVAETEESGGASVPEAITEAPVPTGEADYRDGTYTILIDGKPVEVEVYSQDNPSDTVIYSYVDENGNERIGRTTIEGFGRAIQEAQGIQPTEAEEDTEFPAVSDNVPEVVNVTESTQAPQEVPVTPETINWDALFDNDPEAYFSELQNRYGEKTEKMLNAVIAATQKKLDALNKANPDTQEEIFANEEQKDRLQAKIDALKGMIARLAPAENVEAEPVVEQTEAEPEVAATEEAAPVAEETIEESPEGAVQNESGYIIQNGRIINPTVIEQPDAQGTTNKIFIAEKDGKWGAAVHVVMDDGNESGSANEYIQLENLTFDSKEEAIADALHYFMYYKLNIKPNSPSTKADAFIQYIKDTYLSSAPAAEPAKPVAPTPVDDPIREAQKREKSLATQLRRVGIPHEQKQDMAFNAGKAVADFFATREEYEAYAENATDFKEYNADFERGVEASFANRTQITSVSQDNSVPLESEQTPTTNEEQGTVPAEQTGGPGTSSGDRWSDNTRGEEGDSEATEEPPVRESGSGAEESLEDRYPARKGDVTPKMLQETFGFGSVSSALEQSILNSTYDIMMEMAKMLGISPTSMSHGAALTLEEMPSSTPQYVDASYGRNGKYGTPVTRSYIRIRFGRNLSGIAHEWWHSLDHFLKYYNSGRGNELASEIGVDSFDGRKEVIKAIKAVLKAIKNSGHVDRIDGLPLRTSDKKYFKSRKEIIARAFEEYIIGKFAAAGIEIDGVSKDNHWAQPTAEEMAVITPAFDKLFKILLEKEGKKEGTTMLYKIGEYADERLEDISEEAVQLADDAVALMTNEGGIETVAVPDEQIDEMSEAAGVDANFMIAPDKPVFISNAAIAVEAIKQDKATPEQWLKMIEKNGGLKAGEDKWMGLSEWLKASDKKTLTKQEVLDYIHENMIQIEEQHYLEDIRIEAEEQKQVDAMDDEFEALKKEAEANGENHIDAAEIAYQLMAEKYGDDFTFGFGVDNGHLYVSNLEAAASITGIQPRPERYINETRLHYTTEGLENPREIALVVPTIDSWGEEDEIHFGDAGNGRAVAWIRFGETEAPTAEYKALLDELDRLKEVARELYEEFGGRSNELAEVERKQDEIREEMRAHKNTGLKVLVIDEIQSKRHQAGREKGYKSDFDFYKKEKESIDRLDAMYERRGELIREKVNNEEQELAEIARLDIALDEVANVRDYDALTAEKDAIIQKRLDRLKELNELNSEINKLEDELAHLKVRYDYDYSVAIPDAPFDKNWQDVAMKRMLRYAAENGYDAVAWTKGEQQAERYGIGKVVSSVGYRRTEDGKRVRVNMRGGESLLFDVDILGKVTEVYRDGGVVTNGMALSEIVGVDLAKQIENYEGEVDERGDYNIKSEDFRIGGEGMKGFYDKILPAFVNKYGKKWGIKVEDINLPLVEQAGRVMHSVPVTQEMKDSVMEGQPMFMKKPNGKVYGWTDGKKIYLTRHGFNPNTRIHEYTHLWANAMMQKNPKGWQSVKDLLRGTPVWNEVMNDANYSSIHNNEDMVASEVLSRISGSKNAAKLERMAQQMVDEAKGTMRKLEARGLVQRMKDALNEFWSWVGTELFGIEKFESVEQVTDRVLWDLMNKTDLSNEKTTLDRNAEPSQSDIPTGGVASESEIAPTVITPRNPKADANIANVTKKAKKNLRDFKNGDLKIGEIKSLSDVMQKLHDYLGMGYRGRGMYATYDTPNGTVDFRVNDHNAYGGNFKKEGAENNISIYVEYFYFNFPESNVPYFEFKYTPQDFEAHAEEIFKEILEAMNMLLNDGFFPRKLTYAEMTPHNIENIDDSILYRPSDIQNAAVDYLSGEARNFAIENAVNEEAAKLGVSVTYKTRSEMPNGHENDKGYYNTKTGEIVICAENAVNIADATQTILHEAVAHKGLRALMGDKFNEFINRVYDSLDAETKAKVDALADEQYNGNKAVAMEEYMATLAETEDFVKNSVWDKIKSIFEDIINSILGRNDIKIGDNELRYILRASYNNMVNPRNMDTIKGWAQDQMMREEYKINEATPELMSRTGVDPTEVSRSSAKAVYDKATANRWNEFQREFQDAYQPVRIAIDAIQQETGNIPIEDYENYLLIQNQSSSRSRVEIDEFARRYYSPIIKQVNAIIDMMLESRGLNKHDEKLRADAYAKIRQYMIAKHGLERNEYYQTHRMRKLTAAEKKKAIKEAHDVYDDMVNQINSDTTLSDAERENQIRKASDELNAALIEIETREVPDVRDYSGLTSLFGLKPKQFKIAEAEAQRVVDQFESEFGGAADALWDKINAATNKTLRHSYECGLLSRAQYEEIKSMFKFYIPLRGFDETTAEDVYAYARFEGNRFNPAVQTAGGRTSLADDPLAIIMNMAESEIAQGNKNRAKIALYNYLINRPITDENGEQDQNSLMRVESVWYIKNTDEHGNEFYTIASPDHEGGETTAEFEERMKVLEAEDKAYKSKKGKVDIGKRFQKPMNRNVHYVYLKVNGVEKAIYINGDPKAAEAINGTDKPKPSPLIEKMRDINRLLSSTFTNYSLEFTARNYFRDMIYSHINIDVRESDPAYRKKFRQNWRHNNIKAMLQMLKAYRAGEFDGRPLSEDEAAFVEFMQNGGQTGYTVINSVENHKKDLERAIKNMQKGIERGGVKDSTIFKYTLGAVEMLNEASELVTRFAAFKTSRDMGRDVARSISDAKEITVNFNTKGAQDGKGWMGSLANYFGWSKFFFNASVQGVQNIKAMAQANKLKFCTTVGGVAAFGFVMPIIASAIAEAMGGDDDEYWNIPEYERQNNFCVPIGGGKYAKIPLPIGFREIYAMGDMVAAMAFNKMSTRDVWQVGTDMANKIASIVLPINPLESSANGLSIWHTGLYTALPSSFQFAIQNATNVDWKGAPLQKEYTYNEDDPQWMKAFASNPDWMVGLSKWCNEHWNLDGDYNGWDWSPEKLDNTLSNLFGGIYSLVKKTGKSISMIWNEENRNLSNIPLSGVVLGSGIDKDDRFVNDVYFEEKDYYDSQIGYIKRRAKKFGYDLEDVFEKEKGKHHPKMMEIYSNKNFDFMQEWYKGNKELDELNNEIKKLEKKINSNDNPSEFLLHKLAKKKAELASERREFVNDMLELD